MSPAQDLTFEKWNPRIQLCVLQDEILLVVAAYLGHWRPQDINRLPVTLTEPVRSLDELHMRALELAHADMKFKGTNADWDLLRELALVISAAAAWARHLEAPGGHDSRPKPLPPSTSAAMRLNQYTTAQLARALASVVGAGVPPRVNRVEVAQSADGSCVVTLTEQRRDPALDLEVVVKLTRAQTRAWRDALRRLSRT